MPKLEDVLKEALVLDESERAELAERLLASLAAPRGDGPLDEAGIERLWIAEAQRRLEDYRAGKSVAVAAAQVHAKAEKLLR
jgi:putative addiction module component (TIGR02574 family)